MTSLTWDPTGPPPDATYNGTDLVYWTTVEVNASISCACIMTLKPLIQRAFPSLLSPSKSVPEPPTLQWITPINGDDSNNDYDDHRREGMQPIHGDNDCCRSNSEERASPIARRESHVSAYTVQTRRGSVGVGLHSQNRHHEETLETSRYYHNFTAAPRKASVGADYDLDRDLDLEAQRTCSDYSPISSPVSDDDPQMRGDEKGSGGVCRRCGSRSTRNSSASSSSDDSSSSSDVDASPRTEGPKTASGQTGKGGGRKKERAKGAERRSTTQRSELAEHALRAPPQAHMRRPPPPPPGFRSASLKVENQGHGPKSSSTTPVFREGIWESPKEGVELREWAPRRFPLKPGGRVERNTETGTGGDRA
ncbi:hypothetical protein VTH82DRAFT_3226 [Thermothelomyces myriococcoides]